MRRQQLFRAKLMTSPARRLTTRTDLIEGVAGPPL
jgi:hypothetical protein